MLTSMLSKVDAQGPVAPRTARRPSVSPRSNTAPRILLYSHDTFGLGHLRRSRTIASAFVDAIPNVSALILTGSPVAGRFSFPTGVDHVRLPGVVKLPDGEYAAQNLGLSITEVTDLRAKIIEATVDGFQPDLIIVDKEPTGFRGELLPVLERLHAAKAAASAAAIAGLKPTPKVVLGLRDVLDEPEALIPEWERKGALAALERYYDEAWIYGLPEIHAPLEELPLSPAARRRLVYTGYLRREAISGAVEPTSEEPYVLVTAGGGGDGEDLVERALRAYETDPTLEPRAVIVYGPFLAGETKIAFDERVAALGGRVTALGFASNMESLMRRAMGVIGMGGYNTFCEILSFDRPAALFPRIYPRKEQLIRAEAAERRGLLRMLDPAHDAADPEPMIAAIRDLASQPPPSAAQTPGLLEGLPRIIERTIALLDQDQTAQRAAASQ